MLAEAAARSGMVVGQVVLVEHDVARPECGADPRDRLLAVRHRVHRSEPSGCTCKQRGAVRPADHDDVVRDERRAAAEPFVLVMLAPAQLDHPRRDDHTAGVDLTGEREQRQR